MEHEWEGRWPNVHGSARNFFRLMIYWKSLCLLDGKVRQGGFEVHPNLATTCLSENYEIPKFGWLRNLGISNFPTNPHLPASISGFLSFCSASICSVKLLVSGQRHPLLKGAFRQPCLPRSLWRLLWSNWRTLFTENMMWLFLIHLNSIESTCHIFLISPIRICTSVFTCAGFLQWNLRGQSRLQNYKATCSKCSSHWLMPLPLLLQVQRNWPTEGYPGRWYKERPVEKEG